MTLEYNHECNKCGTNPKSDECYCEKCNEEYAADAYQNGKEEGYKEGYAAAEKELAKDE
jgi:flagellar biosynthesis/type III secretory pathway protein FliH